MTGASTARPNEVTATRSTRQRRLVDEALEGSDEFRSAQEIHLKLRGSGEKIGLATVYRTLQTMTQSGEVDTVRTESGESVYRRCSPAHHHHLVCRGCGRTVEVAGTGVERWTREVAEKHGFTDVSHTIEIFGLCADCA